MDGLSPEGVIEKVRFVARTVEAAKAGDELAGKLEAQFKALADQRAAIKRPVRALFLLNMQGGRATVGGSGTSADAILKLAGAENAAASVNGFKPLVDEAVVEMMPDVIVAMKRSSGGHDTDQVLSMKGMQATPAGAARRVVAMDGLYLLGFGPRTPAAALDLMRELYPDIGAAPGLDEMRPHVLRAGDAAIGTAGREARGRLLIVSSVALLAVAVVLSLSVGPTGITLASLPRVLFALFTGSEDASIAREHLVLVDLRLPRTLLGAFVGASLAVAGAMMQGLFRNPLADPGLIGVSSGAALAAVATIALGNTVAAPWIKVFGVYALPFAAFFGSLAATLPWSRSPGGTAS